MSLINIFSSPDVIKVLLSIFIGGVIGLEREFRGKGAGLRTIIFICLGSTLFTIFSMKFGIARDQTRIAATIVSGIGFLGAGVILRDGGKVVGLTTAATIWLVAALGMGIGGGEMNFIIKTTIIVLLVLWFFPYVETVINRVKTEKSYEIKFSDIDASNKVNKLFSSNKLRIWSHKKSKANGLIIHMINASGKKENHQKLTDILLADSDVEEVRV